MASHGISPQPDSKSYCCYCALFGDTFCLVKQYRVDTFRAKLDVKDAFIDILSIQKTGFIMDLWEAEQPSSVVQNGHSMDNILLFAHTALQQCTVSILMPLYTMWVSCVSNLLHYLHDNFTTGPTSSLSVSPTSM